MRKLLTSLSFSLLVLALLVSGCTNSSTTSTAGNGDEETTTTASPGGQEPSTTAAPDGGSGGDGEAAVKKVCAQCHGLKTADGKELTPPGEGKIAPFESFKGQFQTATPRDWEVTVVRMKDQNKCPMSDEEKTAIVEWLNANVK